MVASPRVAPVEVDLGHVAGHHGLGVEADTREEHLHLLRRRVLGLVEDDEGVIEGPPAHEGQRRHLDGAVGDETLGALGADHVVERVIQRAQVRIDLGHEVAREKPEVLAGLDGRARQHDALHLSTVQRLHGLGHREVALAGTGRADAEGDDRGVDGVGVALLTGRRGTHGLALGAAHDLVAQDLARPQVVLDHVDGARDLGRVERLPALQHQHQLVEESQHLGGVGTGDGDLVALDADLGLGERVLDDAQVLVAGSEQTGHQVRIRYEGGRREGLLGRGIKGHPGGHSILRPPRTCMCRCATLI